MGRFIAGFPNLASRLLLEPILRGLALFGAGILAAFAWRSNYLANSAVLGLIGLWQLASLANATRPGDRDEIETDPPRSVTGHQTVLSVILDEAPLVMLAFPALQPARPLNRAARLMFGNAGSLASFVELALDNPARVNWQGVSYRIDRIEVLSTESTETIWILVDTGSEERRAEARATRELLQVLSHEVMNAVAPITSLAQTIGGAIDEQSPDLEELSKLVGTLGRRAEALQRFTQAYRELARLPEPILAVTRTAAVFVDLERAFVAKWRDQVRLELENIEQDHVEVDAQQVVQALWALLQNAAEATLSSARTPLVGMERRPGAGLTIWISDNGPGITKRDRARIFQNFFTTKQDGTGVGLGIARQIARAHGGEVRLVDTGDGGSIFEFNLPGQPNASIT